MTPATSSTARAASFPTTAAATLMANTMRYAAHVLLSRLSLTLFLIFLSRVSCPEQGHQSGWARTGVTLGLFARIVASGRETAPQGLEAQVLSFISIVHVCQSPAVLGDCSEVWWFCTKRE